MKILWALIKKEFLQIIRDPSSILIAFILPLILSLIYMYGINMDSVNVRMGLKLDDASPKIASLASSFSKNPNVKAQVYGDKDSLYRALTNSEIQGAIIIPSNFMENISSGKTAQILVITDGSNTNTATYVQNYARGIIQQWLSATGYTSEQLSLVSPELRIWYNQDVNSHYFILPGSLAITLSLVGILLTALVIAREWERGTMEALLSSRISKFQFVASKYISYYVLGISSLVFNVFLCVFVYGIPFLGSYTIIFLVGSLFLLTCMGIGLLISTLTKNQFLSSQIALMMGFLPALLLSGFMFPISSMPTFLQYLTAVLPQRYFITFIESEFSAGTITEIVIINTVFLSVLFLILFFLVYKNTAMRLEK